MTTPANSNFDKRFEAIQKQLQRTNLWDETLEKISKCKSNQERVAVVYNLDAIQEEIHLDSSYKAKSEDYAVKLRNSGNVLFQKKKYQDALRFYTQSVLYSPTNKDDSNTLSLAFANRSATLFHLGLYELCLHDIDYALKNGYPQNMTYKLLDRQAKCYQHLKLKQEAIESLEKAKESVLIANLKEDRLKQVVGDIEKELNDCLTLKEHLDVKIRRPELCNRWHGSVPSVAEPINKTYPSSSSAITVEQDDLTDRGIYATRDIKVGEILIVEKSYASVLQPSCNFAHCQHCCNRVTAPVPCRQCAAVCYCSEQCSEESWDEYHYAECMYLDAIQASDLKLGHLSLRMVLKAGSSYLEQYEQTVEKVGDGYGSGLNKFGIYDSNDYQAVYNLVNHADKRTSLDLLRRSVGAVFFLQFLQNQSFFKLCEMSKHRITSVGGHILRHMQMLPCNAHEISELGVKQSLISASETEEIGSAAYATFSLFNHSCDPDVVRHSYGNLCVMRAIKSIKKGQAILDNYGALYPVSTHEERHNTISSQYFFTCQCVPCVNDWPQYYNIPAETPALKCSHCGHEIKPVSPNLFPEKCTDCQENLDIPKVKKVFETSDSVCKSVLEEFLQGSRSPEQTKGVVEKHIEFLSNHVCLPWQDFNNCQEVVKQCYAMHANCYIQE